MTTKTVKSVRENVRNFAGKNGTTYIHMITLDSPVNIEGVDVLEGEYHSLKPTCESFTAGKEAQFETEKRVNGNYTNYKFKPVKAAFGGNAGGGGFVGKKTDPVFEERKQRMIIAQSSVSSAIAFYGETSGKSEEKTMEFAGKIFDWVLKKANAWFGNLFTV